LWVLVPTAPSLMKGERLVKRPPIAAPVRKSLI